MNFTIDLGKIWGLGSNLIRYNDKGQALSVGEVSYTKQGTPFKSPFNSGGLDSTRTSHLGTPVVSDLKLEVYDSFLSPRLSIGIDTVILEVTQTKNIVTTPVVGRPGTIKEYISDGDYQIKIRGVLVDQTGFPEAQVKTLVKILKEPKMVKPISDYLRLFDIENLVVMGYSFFQKEGLKNAQFFEIDCLSDLPENLIIDA
jgi:hypothetical protein